MQLGIHVLIQIKQDAFHQTLSYAVVIIGSLAACHEEDRGRLAPMVIHVQVSPVELSDAYQNWTRLALEGYL